MSTDLATRAIANCLRGVADRLPAVLHGKDPARFAEIVDAEISHALRLLVKPERKSPATSGTDVHCCICGRAFTLKKRFLCSRECKLKNSKAQYRQMNEHARALREKWQRENGKAAR